MPRQLTSALIAGIVASLCVSAVALAHLPVGGAVKEYVDYTSLPSKWGASGYPSWFTNGMATAFGADWPSSSYNNTRMPTFSYSSSGAGTVWYKGTTGIAACDGNNQWIGCSSGWGSTSWNVWLRNFAANGYDSFGWYDTGSCSGTCFDSRRVALHEIEHVSLAVTNHDSQGELNTIMGSATPSYPNSGWNTHQIQRCDESAAQLLYDVAASAGPYADCFDHITNHGTYGLVTSGTVAATSYGVCGACQAP